MINKKYLNGKLVDLTEEEIKEIETLNNSNMFPTDKFEIEMINLRHKRNRLLTESDWTVLPDSPIANKTAWQTYRTELRDLTNGLTTVEQVEAVTWPTKPGA